MGMGTRVLKTAAAVAATAALVGCDAIGQARRAADTISAVGALAQTLGNHDTLTYTAEYRLADGSTTTAVQRPPDTAFVGPAGRFVSTPQRLIMCDAKKICQSAVNRTGELDITNAGMVPSAAGAGFVTAPIALALLSPDSITDGVTVHRSTRKIAGQQSTCLKLDGGDAPARRFTVCVTDAGLLASFKGDLDHDQTADIELTSYSTTVDPQVFAVPAGYQVINVDHLQLPKP
jgi:hypothetical protein